MFRSKISSILLNNLKKSQTDVGSTNVSPFRLLSTTITPDDVSPTTSQTYDKLYKKIEIEVRGNDRAVLESYGKFLLMAADHLKIIVGNQVTPYKAIHERYTVLKSVHIYKKHRVQYETRTYYKFLDFLKLTGSTADTFLEYIQRNLPEGVAMKVTKVELQKLPKTVEQATSESNVSSR